MLHKNRSDRPRVRADRLVAPRPGVEGAWPKAETADGDWWASRKGQGEKAVEAVNAE